GALRQTKTLSKGLSARIKRIGRPPVHFHLFPHAAKTNDASRSSSQIIRNAKRSGAATSRASRCARLPGPSIFLSAKQVSAAHCFTLSAIRHQIVWLTPLPEDLASRLRKWSPKIKAEMKTAAFLP